jgi:hypothetical protein
MKQVGNTNQNLIAERHIKKELGKPRCRWMVDIKTDLREKIRP